MRSLLTLAFAVAVATGLALSMGTGAEAARGKKASVPKSKQCTATTIDNKKVSFRCKANQTCCFDGLMAKGNCVPAGQVCI